MNLNGKTALVTGGAHRIGGEITLGLAKAGANVVINYHNSAEEAERLAEEVQRLGSTGLPVQADVMKYDQVEKMVDAANKRFGGVDILGFKIEGPIKD